ncbi:CHAT domain-containing protein [Flammeovirga sp. MY04]|nr:CHAT domain-containing protein [Flammeovirga sp. MY04]ANQ49254.1 CHAT domain-containing protein [Flammeovirga sp. MY04]
MYLIKRQFISIFFYLIPIISFGLNAEDPKTKIILDLEDNGALNEALQASEDWIQSEKSKYGEQSVHVLLPLLVYAELTKNRKEFQYSIEALEEAKEIMNISSGWLYPDYALVNNYMAFAYIQNNQVEMANRLINEAEMIYVKTLTKQHPDYLFCLINKALLKKEGEYFEKSIELFDEALALYSSNAQQVTFLHQVLDENWIKVQKAKVYVDWFEFEKANQLLSEVQEKLIKNSKEKSPLYTETLLCIADNFYNDHQYKLSYSFYDKYKNHLNTYLGKYHPYTLTAYYKLGHILKSEGFLKKATQYYTIIEKNYNAKNGDKNVYAKTLLGMADIYLKRGNTKQASDYLSKADQVAFTDKDINLLSLRLSGELSYIEGNYITSELQLMELISIVRQERIFFTRHYSDAVTILGELFITLGRSTDAINICDSEVRFLTKREMTNSYSFFDIQLTKIYAHIHHGDHENYEEQLNEIEKKIIGYLSPKHHFLVKLNYIRGYLEMRDGHYDKANQEFNKANTIAHHHQFLDKQSERLRIIDAKANIYLKQLKLDKALDQYHLLQNSFESSSIYQPYLLARIAYIKALQQDWDDAEDLIIKAVNMRLTQYDEQLKFTSEDEKINFIHHSSEVFEYFFSLLSTEKGMASTKMIKQAYNLQINYRKYFLNEAIERKEEIASLNKYRNEQLFSNYAANLYQQKSRLATANFLSVSDRKKLKLDSYMTIDRIKNLEKSLVFASDKKADIKVDKSLEKWEEIKNKLSDDEIAIEIIKLKNIEKEKDKYIALILDNKMKQPFLCEIGLADKLEQDIIKEYKNCTSLHAKAYVMFDDKEYVPPYNHFWKPISDALLELGLEKKTLYVSQDGIYNVINLNILQNPITKKYLIEENDIHLVISTSNLKKEANTIKSSKEILLIGNPVFKKEEEDALQSRGIDDVYAFELDNLPGTAVEIDNSAELFRKKGWNVKVLSKDQATEENIKNISVAPNILHIATHGFYLNQLKDPILNHQLLKSGLFLSEIAHKKERDVYEIYQSGNDGILTAYEVKGINLNNTELLVLSACQSGVSDVSDGDGISGLQYAFSIAGVQSIIMSLWNVDDKATQKLMNEFYQQWFLTGNKSLAFKKAQLKLKEEYEIPYYWGAFVMIQ